MSIVENDERNATISELIGEINYYEEVYRMGFAENVFAHHPFIYYVDGKYYAFGSGVCAEVDNGSVLLELKYKEYLSAQIKNVDNVTAWRIFHRLVSEAVNFRNQKGIDINTAEKFHKLKFSSTQLIALEKQRMQYVDFYQKHNLIEYYK